jgi:hypothetical protein
MSVTLQTTPGLSVGTCKARCALLECKQAFVKLWWCVPGVCELSCLSVQAVSWYASAVTHACAASFRAAACCAHPSFASSCACTCTLRCSGTMCCCAAVSSLLLLLQPVCCHASNKRSAACFLPLLLLSRVSVLHNSQRAFKVLPLLVSRADEIAHTWRPSPSITSPFLRWSAMQCSCVVPLCVDCRQSTSRQNHAGPTLLCGLLDDGSVGL